MNFYQRLRAYREGKKIFVIPDLNRVCFTWGLKHCKKKFMGHKVVKCGWFKTIFYILIGFNKNKA